MTDDRQIRILIAGDRSARRLAALLSGIRSLVVVGSAATGSLALAQAAAEQPDIILLDADLDSNTGFSLMPRLFGAALHAKIVVIAETLEPEEQREALHRGASGVLAGQIAADRILQCVQSVSSGSHWLDGSAISGLLEERGFQPHSCGRSREPGKA